jgi:hypothetical protein
VVSRQTNAVDAGGNLVDGAVAAPGADPLEDPDRADRGTLGEVAQDQDVARVGGVVGDLSRDMDVAERTVLFRATSFWKNQNPICDEPLLANRSAPK